MSTSDIRVGVNGTRNECAQVEKGGFQEKSELLHEEWGRIKYPGQNHNQERPKPPAHTCACESTHYASEPKSVTVQHVPSL
jgi:hypothetical protein